MANCLRFCALLRFTQTLLLKTLAGVRLYPPPRIARNKFIHSSPQYLYEYHSTNTPLHPYTLILLTIFKPFNQSTSGGAVKRVLFIDRDGTIIKEPEDEQVDSFEKFDFLPNAISSLKKIALKLDFELVMVTNQDGLGTESFPEEDFWR